MRDEDIRTGEVYQYLNPNDTTYNGYRIRITGPSDRVIYRFKGQFLNELGDVINTGFQVLVNACELRPVGQFETNSGSGKYQITIRENVRAKTLDELDVEVFKVLEKTAAEMGLLYHNARIENLMLRNHRDMTDGEPYLVYVAEAVAEVVR